MADDIFGLNARGIARTNETNRRVLGALPRAPQIKRRVLDGSGSDDGGSGSGSCACCDPSNCDDYPISIDGCTACNASPREWQVVFGSMDSADCPNFSSPQTITHYAYCVYRSTSFLCHGAAALGGCSGISTDCCTGEGTFTFDGDQWQLTSDDCSAGCSASNTPVCVFKSTGVMYDAGDTVTRPCVGGYFTTFGLDMSGDWVRGSPDNCPDASAPALTLGNECNGIEIYLVPCCPEQEVLDEVAYSFFELSVSEERDDENRNGTTLTLYIGDIAAIVWEMPIGKDWCCLCENKLELRCCGPYGFSGVPESVCISPKTVATGTIRIGVSNDNDTIGSISWGGCCNPFGVDSDEIPRSFLITTSMLPQCYDGGTFYDHLDTFCCVKASGVFVLTWDPTYAAWVYLFGPDACDPNAFEDDPFTGFTLSRFELICSAGVWNLRLYAFTGADVFNPGMDDGASTIPLIDCNSPVGWLTGDQPLTPGDGLCPIPQCAWNPVSIVPII